MSTLQLTKPLVAALQLPTGKSEVLVWDATLKGFGVRIRKGGKRTWVVQYRVGGRQRRVTLGPVSAIDLDRARFEAKTILANVALGSDPAAKKARARADAAITLGSLVDRFLAFKEQDGRRPATIRETRRYLKTAWAPVHDIPLSTMVRADIANRLSAITKERGAVSGERARAALSAFFTWAMREGVAQDNPVRLTNHQHRTKARDRLMTDEELRDIWNAAGDGDYGKIVRLLMLTGQRRQEVAGLPWSELDLDNGMWTIPKERTKNGLEQKLPLTAPVLSILRSVEAGQERDWLFGTGKNGFSGWSKSKKELNGRILVARRSRAAAVGADPNKVEGIPAWNVHDFRHTLTTKCGDDFDVDPHVVEAVLNHVTGSKPGMSRVYNHAKFVRKKRVVLTLWTEHVMATVTQTRPNIVPLRQVVHVR